jgi:hypothetical protein
LDEVTTEIYLIDAEVVPLIPEVPLPKSKQGTWPKVQFRKDGQVSANAIRYYGEDHSAYRTDIIVRTAPINLGSDKQVKSYLLSIGWVPTEWNYKKDPATGKPIRINGEMTRTSPKLTLDSLESCKWPGGHGEMGVKITRRLMLRHRKSNCLESWLRDVRPDGRISAEAIPMGTPTARMVHRKVVNVPGKDAPLGPELRACFTTVPGYKRVGIDLVSCQVYALAHYMDDDRYREAVQTGDPHVFVQEMAKLPTRSKGKKLHYTTLFGGGPPKIASDLDMTLAQAKIVKAIFFENLPALPKLINQLKHEWKTNGGWIKGIDGRKIWVRAEHMLLVYAMQSLEAIVMKNFINILSARCLEWAVDYQLITTMHDECQFLVSDGHPSSVPVFTGCAKAAIIDVNNKFKLRCPQEIDIKVGETWSECH